jgi:hypothetical protein
MYDVAKAVKEVCEKHSIVVYDNFVNSGIHTANLSYWTTDNCHWNDSAHEMVGKNLAKFVADSFRYVYGNTSSGGGGDDTHIHSYTGMVTTAATCTTAGVKTYVCECGHSYTESIPAVGHSYVGGVCSVCGASGDRYVGKTFRITGNHLGVFNATAIVGVDSDCVAGKTVVLTLVGHAVNNLESGSTARMAVFGDNTGVCGNSAYTGAASAEATVNTYVADGAITSIASYTLTTVNSKYLKIPAPVKYVSTANPASFVIDQISVTVDGNKKEIVDFGGFFSGESCTFE